MHIRALLIEFFCLYRKFLVFNLVQRNLKLKYRQSFLGVLWTLFVPAASALVYYAVFLHVMRVDIPHYLLFLISGLLPWVFFSTTLINGMESIAGNYALLNKIPIPSHVFPFAESITNFINLLMAIPVILVVFALSGAPGGLYILTVPIFLILLFFQAYGFALLLSVAFVYFRDLRHLLGIAIQMWLYLTPILYHTEMLPPSVQPWIWLNPVAYIFDGLHSATVFGKFHLDRLWISCLWTIAILTVGIAVTKRYQNNLVEGI